MIEAGDSRCEKRSGDKKAIVELVDISHPLNYKLAALVTEIVIAAGLIGAVSAAEYPVGSGPDDWWTAYPDQHPGAGSEVDHPSWVLDLLEDGPILILDHSTNCEACIKQEDAANAALEEVGEDAIAFENLIADPENERANALFEAPMIPTQGSGTSP